MNHNKSEERSRNLEPGEVVVNVQTIESPYLTCEEAAAYIRSTRHAIYALVKRGRIKPMPGRPGRLLFTRIELDSYLRGKFRR